MLTSLVIVGCSGSVERHLAEPRDMEEPVQVDFTEIFGWAEAEISIELYFVQLDGEGSVWHLKPESRDALAVTPVAAAQGQIVTLQGSHDHTELFTWRRDLDREVGRVESVLTNEVSVATDASLECLGPLELLPDGISMVERASEADHNNGSRVWATGPQRDPGEIGTIGLAETRVFCPVFWGGGLSSYAWSVQVRGGSGFEARLFIEHDGTTEVLHVPGCTLMPADVTEDESLMAVTVGCDDVRRSGLFLLPLDAPEQSALRLVRSGAVGPAVFDPTDTLIAYTRMRQRYGNLEEPVVEVLNLDTSQYLEVPIGNSSWPAWIGLARSHGGTE